MACLREQAPDGRRGAVSCDETDCLFRRFQGPSGTEFTPETLSSDCLLQLRLRIGTVEESGAAGSSTRDSENPLSDDFVLRTFDTEPNKFPQITVDKEKVHYYGYLELRDELGDAVTHEGRFSNRPLGVSAESGGTERELPAGVEQFIEDTGGWPMAAPEPRAENEWIHVHTFGKYTDTVVLPSGQRCICGKSESPSWADEREYTTKDTERQWSRSDIQRLIRMELEVLGVIPGSDGFKGGDSGNIGGDLAEPSGRDDTKFDAEHPPVHFEWIDGFKIGDRVYAPEDVTILLKLWPNYATHPVESDELLRDDPYGLKRARAKAHFQRHIDNGDLICNCEGDS